MYLGIINLQMTIKRVKKKIKKKSKATISSPREYSLYTYCLVYYEKIE